MDTQELKYQQLLSARHKYSKHTRAKEKKFKQMKEMEKEIIAIKQQEREIAEVEDELTELRREYGAVCRERGHAHKVAQLVQLQEKEVESFQDRIDQICCQSVCNGER
ncbi:hypothetical protein HDE_08270 [Halotydeus destructor]|nr:hypothetical protein HDE_08270 [Halotydeus destructor]